MKKLSKILSVIGSSVILFEMLSINYVRAMDEGMDSSESGSCSSSKSDTNESNYSLAAMSFDSASFGEASDSGSFGAASDSGSFGAASDSGSFGEASDSGRVGKASYSYKLRKHSRSEEIRELKDLFDSVVEKTGMKLLEKIFQKHNMKLDWKEVSESMPDKDVIEEWGMLEAFKCDPKINENFRNTSCSDCDVFYKLRKMFFFIHPYYVNKTFKDDKSFECLYYFLFKMMDCFDAFYYRCNIEDVFECLIQNDEADISHKDTQSTKGIQNGGSPRTILTIDDIVRGLVFLRTEFLS